MRKAIEITIERGQECLVRHYLTRYANPQRTDRRYENRVFGVALHCAAFHGCEPIARLLLHKGSVRLSRRKETALHVAARRGHAEIVALFLDNGVEMDVLDDTGRTPMEMAVKSSRHSVIELLRSRGAAENLDQAIEKHGAGWAKLLEGKFEGWEDYPGFEGRYGARDTPPRLSTLRTFQSHLLGQDHGWHSTATLICAAIEGRDVHVLRSLLDRGFGPGPDALPQPYKFTDELPLAVQIGDVAIIQELLARGADPTDDGRGGTPIYMAADQDRADIMALFLRSGTDFKEGQWLEASLHVAALAGAQSVIALLLDRGIDLEVQMFGKGTPLDVAASSGKVGAVCQLLRRGAVARLDGDDKGPLILELFMHAREDHLAEHFDDILKLLLQAGISLHVGNEHGNLVHHVLVKTPQLIDKLWEFKTPQPVDELKAPHVKDDFVNSYGDTPLWLALRLRYLDRILDLLCVEQNLYRKNSSGRALMGHMERFWGHTSLYYLPFLHRRGPMRRNPPIVHDTASLGLDAAWVINSLALLTDGGHARQHNRVTKETVSSLISRGANVNQRDRNRVTPLLDAMVTMDEEIVTLLLENGADPNVKDCAGDTALHIFASRWPANPTVAATAA